MADLLLAIPFLTIGIGGTLAIMGGALALGIRHGFDWDHIAAIADITSATATEPEEESAPAVLHTHAERSFAFDSAPAGALHGGSSFVAPARSRALPNALDRLGNYAHRHRTPLSLGTMYALGHGSMVVVLGLLAILFKEILPGWIDPIMERVVGITLVALAAYLFFSVFRYFRGGEFQLRSRWTLIFAVAGRAWRWATGGLAGHDHDHGHHHHIDQRYGGGTAYSIGLLHGIGAETGTQVLIIGAAVGAGSKGMSVATLLIFVAGLLLSNSLITIASTTGFISVQRRQAVYVGVGLIAAIFSLVVGMVFLSQSANILPSMDPLVRWIGGPG